MMIEFTPEQKRAYSRYILARDKVNMINNNRNAPYIPHSDVIRTVDVENMNHPLFEQNDDWLEYQEAFKQWLAVEPEFRNQERMRMSRGDYGTQDSWEDRTAYTQDRFYNPFKEE